MAANVLRVGVIENAPFAEVNSGKERGIAVDLWKRIAQMNGFAYRLIPYKEDVNAALKALSEGKMDILIGPISTTHERESYVDFTRPFFINQVGVVFRDEKSLFHVLVSEIFGGDLGRLFLTLFALLVFFAALLFLARGKKERKKQGVKRSIIEELWESASILVALETRDNQKTVAVRAIAFVGLLFGVGFLAFFTSVLTSRLTVENLEASRQRFPTVRDLNRAHLIAVQGQTTIEYARKYGEKTSVAKSLDEAISAVAKGEVDGLVEDYAIAEVVIKDWKGEQALVLSSLTLAYDEYAFALQKNSPLRQTVDAAITELQDSGAAKEICSRYIEDLADLCEL